jgi:hypothetical protein
LLEDISEVVGVVVEDNTDFLAVVVGQLQR